MDVVILTSGPKNLWDTQYIYRYLGPYKVASSCRNAGFTVQIIDHVLFMSDEQIIKYLYKFVTPDTAVLAISCTFMCKKLGAGSSSYRDVLDWPKNILLAVKMIKMLRPKIRIVLGGYNANIVPGHGLVDAAILNYGEDIFTELVSHYIQNTPEPCYDIHCDLPGETRKIYTAPKQPVYDIKCDTHRFTKNDCIVSGEVLPLEISRGCVFRCKFCHHLLLGRKKLDYLRSFDCIREEIIYNYNMFQTREYYVICDTFNDTLEKMHGWHKMVKSLPFAIRYTCYLRADLIERYPEQADILRETGLFSTFHGIESFGETAAYMVGKAWSGKRAREFLPHLYHDLWQDKIHQVTGFIIGLPGDTRESILDTINWHQTNHMYRVIMEPLNLSNNKNLLGNFSEFEKNFEKYGYRFDEHAPDNWKLAYWDRASVDHWYQTEIAPRLWHTNSWFTSWQLMSLYSSGIYDKFPMLAEKSWQITQDWEQIKVEINQSWEKFLIKYTALLDSI